MLCGYRNLSEDFRIAAYIPVPIDPRLNDIYASTHHNTVSDNQVLVTTSCQITLSSYLRRKGYLTHPHKMAFCTSVVPTTTTSRGISTQAFKAKVCRFIVMMGLPVPWFVAHMRVRHLRAGLILPLDGRSTTSELFHVFTKLICIVAILNLSVTCPLHVCLTEECGQINAYRALRLRLYLEKHNQSV